jgi:hypothetical protein
MLRGVLLHVHWRVCGIVFGLFFNGLTWKEPIIVVSCLECWLFLIMWIVRCWSLHENRVRILWESENSIALTWHYLWWISDHVAHTTETNRSYCICCSTRNPRALLWLRGMYVRGNLCGVTDGSHHGVRNLKHGLSHRISLHLTVSLLWRFHLNPSINVLLVSPLHLSPSYVLLKHVYLFL